MLLDSLLHTGLATRSDLEQVCATVPGASRLMDQVDRAESGTETLVRVRLRARRIRVRAQVAIDTVGRVDLVVGERLVIEVDSDRWHSSPEQVSRDRRRDRALVRLGYIVLRLGYREVIDDWRACEADVPALIRAREHRWRARHRAPGRVIRR